MSQSKRNPPDFNAIYFDTNTLLGAGWPDPTVILHNVFVVGVWWNIDIVIPEPVLREAEDHWGRGVEAQASRLDRAGTELGRLSRPVVCNVDIQRPSIDQLREHYRQIRDNTLAKYKITVSPFSNRAIQDIFGLATKYVAPFKHEKEGAGFQDAVILLSILEHLKPQSSLNAILVTNDDGIMQAKYKDLVSAVDQNRLRAVKLDEAWKLLFDPYFDHNVVQPWQEERNNASEAVARMIPALKEFLTSHLTEPMLKSGWSGTVVRLLTIDNVRILGVETPIPELGLPPDRRVELLIHVTVDCTALVKKTGSFAYLIFGSSQGTNPTLPAEPEEVEEKTAWVGAIRASADIVHRQFCNIAPQSLVAEAELRGASG